ncbi:hypothetical protein QZJ86_04245 [Methylomonas montana]|uniref:hypothetical protein n=1 Tax=Methylomonas montana TaxID=3058963 RepID=UPI00265A47DA|nr:hypothetical protein [Methylomonas montana]WKJ91346.1 hypothetical protein QZJ86_04245 [Methylomonas montana]
MNIKTVDGNKLIEVKNRLKALQVIVRDTQHKISCEQAAHADRLNSAMKNRMSPAEFLALFPNPPVSGANLTAYTAVKNGTDTLSPAIDDPLVAEDFLKLDQHYAERAKPSRSLTESEFLQLYPAPTFTAENAAIAAAQVECDKLAAFLRSGPANQYPAPFDVDFLSTTAVSYP